MRQLIWQKNMLPEYQMHISDVTAKIIYETRVRNVMNGKDYIRGMLIIFDLACE